MKSYLYWLCLILLIGFSRVLVGFWRLGHLRVCWSFEISLESEEEPKDHNLRALIWAPPTLLPLSSMYRSTHLIVR